VRLADDRLINGRQLKTDGVPPYRRTQNYVAHGLKIYDLLGKSIFPPINPPAERPVCEIRPIQPAEKGSVLEILPATARQTRPRFVSPPPKLQIVEEDLFYDPHSGARFVIGPGAEDRPAESVDPPPDFDSAPLPSDDIMPRPLIHAETRVRTIYGRAFANGAGGRSF
jgi:hypothetical protein